MNPISPDRFDAVLFDLDGVLTATAKVHAACWKRLFDDFLEERAKAIGEPLKPFDIDEDYKRYVDGKLRYEGVRSFLESRGIDLPEGTPDESPSNETVCGLGNRKDAMVHEVLEAEGVDVYEGSVRLVEHVRSRGIRTAVVSASKNCKVVLEAARISHLFDQVVDGEVAEQLRLPGKPQPDTFLTAAERIGVVPKRAVVVEDAISGVQAGRAGGFGLVIGVDRKGDPESLRQSGADIVVKDLSELV
ncbi:MAG: beta-phosphoglucomutase family hydrolase [Deltaproteobacteria bacterium]|nr:beta-phosphoglucomutase family hydrolase [Deltaproteobacteria bacterium]